MYYTICAEYNDEDEHTRAILVLKTENVNAALVEWTKVFNIPVSKYNIFEGIHIEPGFERLFTEHSRKYLLDAKVGKNDVPLVSYINKITLKHPKDE